MLKKFTIFLGFALILKVFGENSSCGIRSKSIGLIVGGEVINQGDFPWLVSLLKVEADGGKKKFFCGGVLVSKNKVLSAAHCVQNKNANQVISTREVILFLGGHDLDNPFQPGTLSVSPSKIFVHPEWNPFIANFDADLSVLITENIISFSNNISPICLLEPGQFTNAREGIIVGYGQSEDKTKRHETIPRFLKVPIKSNEDCFLENAEFAKISSKRTFCAGPKNGKGACRGDSGSGLFVKVGSTYYLKGVVSSSLFNADGDCDVQNYAVYTDITKFRKFIDDPTRPLNPQDSTEIFEQYEIKSTKSPQIGQTSCGVMSDYSSLIQGGKESLQDQFPWTVAIFTNEKNNYYEFRAVGSLISNKHVISIANPLVSSKNPGNLVPIDPQKIKMYFGIRNLRQTFENGVLAIDGALKIIFHPEISLNIPKSADIAVIFLQSPLFMTKFISPVCLWDFSLTRGETMGKVGYGVGWGVNEFGVYSEFKKQVPMEVLDQNTCQVNFQSFNIQNKYFCAKGIDGIGTSCEYDDPFYVKINKRWFLRGLINIYFQRSNDKLCNPKAPVLYEGVSEFSNWISSVIS